MVVFYVEDIQEIGWCYVYISLPIKNYIRGITLLVDKKKMRHLSPNHLKLYNTGKNKIIKIRFIKSEWIYEEAIMLVKM